MNSIYSQSISNMPLSSEQKRQLDELIIRFSRKEISIVEMYNCIERIKGGGDAIFSHVPGTSGSASSPIHIP